MNVERKRSGRPPKIDRAAIAHAITEIGPDELTMQRVADHLGVSLAGLYRYVNGRDELLRLAAEQTLARMKTPEERGQHWAAWLREWAHYMHELIRDHRELIEYMLDGSVSPERTIELVGNGVNVLVSKGLDAKSAFSAWETVSALALGIAMGDPVEPATTTGPGWVSWARFVNVDPDALAALRQLAESGEMPGPDEHLDECLTTVFVGVAVRAGLPLDEILDWRRPQSA